MDKHGQVMNRYAIGEAVPRVEDEAHLTGMGHFVDDLALNGQCHGYVLRSPWPHAVVRSISVSRAQRMPGVLLVLTAADYEADGLGKLPYVYPLAPGWNLDKLHNPGRLPLASHRVRHVGDALAFIVAEHLEEARDAAEAIEVDYLPLASVTATSAAADDGAPAVWDDCPGNITFRHGVGDAEATNTLFRQAAHIVGDRFVISRVSANTIEPRGMICDYDKAEGFTTIYASAQSAFGLRRQMAESIFGESVDNFRVVISDVGGSFGMKGAFYPEYALTAWASRKLARPVRWISDRSEALISDNHSRDNISEIELAIDGDGKFLALRARTTANLGAYPSTMPTGPTTSHVGGMAGVYTFQAAHVEITGVYTHTNSTGSLRGAGRPEATYVIERIIDKAARELGQDPADLRRRNMIPTEQLPYRTPFYFKFEDVEFGFFEYDSGNFVKALDMALDASDYGGISDRKREARGRGLTRGFGLAYFIEMAASPGFEYVALNVSPEGLITLFSGTANNGQGHHTLYTQVACDTLGVPAHIVRVVESDTGEIPQGSGTSSSRTTTMGGSATLKAAEKLIDEGKKIAARLMQALPEDINYTNGWFQVAGSDRWVSFAEIASEATLPGEGRPGLSVSAIHKSLAPNWPNGCHACEVEIDTETGEVKVVSYTVVDDAGTVMNPTLLHGQVYGGVAMGLGQILMESIHYDASSGQVVSGSFIDYAMPRARDVGEICIQTSPVPTQTNPLGVKGGGESGTIGSLPCVMNAIDDALADIGAESVEMPATSDRIWRSINRAKTMD
tara:strand:+ start:269 stop:2641 length:2373 start_codon:yes stop_codon:yes gene_type:complete